MAMLEVLDVGAVPTGVTEEICTVRVVTDADDDDDSDGVEDDDDDDAAGEELLDTLAVDAVEELNTVLGAEAADEDETNAMLPTELVPELDATEVVEAVLVGEELVDT